MPDLHTYILDTYYWRYIDRGRLPEQTPLIQHKLGIGDLTYQISCNTGYSQTQVNRALHFAIQEVDL